MSIYIIEDESNEGLKQLLGHSVSLMKSKTCDHAPELSIWHFYWQL